MDLSICLVTLFLTKISLCQNMHTINYSQDYRYYQPLLPQRLNNYYFDPKLTRIPIPQHFNNYAGQPQLWTSINSRQDQKHQNPSEVSITTEKIEMGESKPKESEMEKVKGEKPEMEKPEKEEEKPEKDQEMPEKEKEEEEKPEKPKLSPFEEFREDIERPEFYLPIYNDLTFIGLVFLLMPAIIPTILIPLASYVAGSLLIPVVRLNYYVNHVLNPNAGP